MAKMSQGNSGVKDFHAFYSLTENKENNALRVNQLRAANKSPPMKHAWDKQ